MIVEIRTYTLQPGTVPQFEERFAQALPARAKVSPLAAFWHTEVGQLNQVIHVWPYEDLEERTRKRAEATKLDGWPPNTREFVVEQKSQIYIPAPFSPKLEPRQLGGLYEIRVYTMRPGAIPEQIERWSAQIGERTKLSPLAFAGHSELGELNLWCHIWAYKDAAERFEVREKARREGIWPPRGGTPGRMHQAGEHAGGPGFVLAAALAARPISRAAESASGTSPARPLPTSLLQSRDRARAALLRTGVSSHVRNGQSVLEPAVAPRPKRERPGGPVFRSISDVT